MEQKIMCVGVIGAGAISDIYLKNMINRFGQLQVAAIAARHIENARKKAEQYGIKACTVEELLADGQIDMVVNLTPVGAHYELIRSALLAGKHVYTEKTLTDDPEKARELLDLAEEKDLYLGCAPDTFLGAAWQTARSLIDGESLGEIHSFAISANRCNDLLLSLFPFLRQPGAGVLYDYGVYYLTALVSLLGPVARVGGIVGRPYPTHRNILPASPDFGNIMDTPNESQVSAVVQLKNGICGTFHIDTDSNAADRAFFAIYGTKGILYLTDPNQFGGTVKFLPNDLDFRKPQELVELWNFSQYGDNCRGIGPAEMADAILSGRKNRASKEMACHVLEVLTAILRGGGSGAFIDILSSCDAPEPMKPKSVGIKNLGHVAFQAKDMDAMLHFYGDILGMKRHFTLTTGDFEDSLRRQNGGQIPLRDAVNMVNFYTRGLGLNKVMTLTYGDLRETLEKSGQTDTDTLQNLALLADRPWIDYIEAAPHQYIELFHTDGLTKKEHRDLQDVYGYQHICLEVADIHAAWDAVIANGLKPDTPIRPGADGACQFWLVDPDGNRLELMEYAAGGKTGA